MVDKSQFFTIKEFIPEIKSEKEFAAYPNMDLEDK
jgi:hypothetical protein